MTSWLRDFRQHFAAARIDLTYAWLALVGFLIGGCTAARGADPAEAQAKAALALAKAKRDREAASCFTDYDKAAAEARRTNKPLVLWIGVKCSAHPGLRKELADAVHCHLTAAGRDPSPRVVFQGADGIDWFVRAETINAETARRIRAKWEPPPIRPSVSIGEELYCPNGNCPRPR
jgi:hypothetical protein